MADKITFRTNHVPRPIINAWELSPKEQAEFDYLDWKAIEAGNDSASFFRYRGELYDLSQFYRVIRPDATRHHPMELASADFQGWDGYMSDSFFSGMVVKYAGDDGETIIVGSYYVSSEY